MEQVHIKDRGYVSINRAPEFCPECDMHVAFELAGHVFAGGAEFDTRQLFLTYQCPRPSCGAAMLARFWENPATDIFELERTYPAAMEPLGFDEVVGSVSPSFIEIFEQAARAEAHGLNHVAGPGYRKALEFLVRESAAARRPDDKGKIEDIQLSTCINNYVDDERIKEAAKRAAWLGNDEVHYLRKWPEKDLQQLKALIRLTANWIAATEQLKAFEDEMPEGR